MSLYIVRGYNRNYDIPSPVSYWEEDPIYWDDSNGCWTEDRMQASKRNKTNAKLLLKLASIGKPEAKIEIIPA